MHSIFVCRCNVLYIIWINKLKNHIFIIFYHELRKRKMIGHFIKKLLLKVIFWVIYHSTWNKEPLLQVLYYIFKSHSNILLQNNVACPSCCLELSNEYSTISILHSLSPNIYYSRQFSPQCQGLYMLSTQMQKTFIQRINGYV